MNSLIESEFPLHETQRLRYDLLQTLTDSDLAYKLPGDNPTLGALCREIGEVEYSYIQSSKPSNTIGRIAPLTRSSQPAWRAFRRGTHRLIPNSRPSCADSPKMICAASRLIAATALRHPSMYSSRFTTRRY